MKMTASLLRSGRRAIGVVLFKSGRKMFNSLFKIIYFVELVLITGVRSAGTAKYKREKVSEDHSSTVDFPC